MVITWNGLEKLFLHTKILMTITIDDGSRPLSVIHPVPSFILAQWISFPLNQATRNLQLVGLETSTILSEINSNHYNDNTTHKYDSIVGMCGPWTRFIVIERVRDCGKKWR